MITRFILAFSALFLTTGCDEIADRVDQWRFPNSTIIVSKCIERNASAATRLALDARTYCAREHAKLIPISSITGRGGPSCGPNQPANAFKGAFTNRSPDNVITQVRVSIRSGENLWLSQSTDTWIPPNRQQDLMIPLHGTISNCPREFTWSVEAVRGVSLTLR